MEICRNCGNEISLNFCPNCGQKKFKRIDAKYIKDEFQYTILHTNKGFFYTLKNLVLSPGKTAREYLDGNRVNHYKPILLAFLLTGFSTLIIYKFLNFGNTLSNLGHTINENQSSNNFMDEYSGFMQDYATFFIFSTIPFFALASYIAFRSYKDNYFEHLIINVFIYSYYLILCFVLVYPLAYFIHSSDFLIYSSFAMMIIFAFLTPWIFRNIYPRQTKRENWLNCLVYILLSGIGYIFISIIIAIAYFLFYVMRHGVSSLSISH